MYYSAKLLHVAAEAWFSRDSMDQDTDMADGTLIAANVGTVGSSNPAAQQRPADVAAQRLQQLTVGLSSAHTEALLAAAERELARLAQENERAAALAEHNELMERVRALEDRWNIPNAAVGGPNHSSDALLQVLLQRYLQQEVRRDVDGSGEGNAGPSGSKASLAKSMNKPKVWEGSNGGERRAVIFLREVKAWAELHGGRGEDILQNYLGDKVKGLFIQQLDAWQTEGIEATWERMCEAFCTIVGETEEEDKAKALDDLASLRVRQRRNHTLGEYKVYFQHELLRAGGGVPDALAVRWFINGLGCKELRSACQPDLTAGKLKNVDDAFLCAKGQEAKLSAVGIRPFNSAQHNAASNASGTVASMQGKPSRGGNKQAQHNGHGQGGKRPHTQAFARGPAQQHKRPRNLPALPAGLFYNNNGLPVDSNGVFVCSKCYGKKDEPKQGCTKHFHPVNKQLPGPPGV